MKTIMQPNVMQFLDEAAQTFDAAMRAGARMQGEAARWWADMLQEANSIQKIQHRAQSMMPKGMPDAQQNIGPVLSLIDRNYRTSINLLRRAFESSQSTSYMDAQNRMRELWQESLGALRSNARDLVQINTRLVETWGELANHNANQVKNMAAASSIATPPIKPAVKPAVKPAARTTRTKPQRRASGESQRARPARSSRSKQK